MIVKDEVLPSRAELSSSQRALLEERLQRARQTNARASEARSSIPRRGAVSELPLSFAQERLWFLDQLEPGSAVYNVCQAVRMRGELDLAALEHALNGVVQRHEILRTNFVASDGSPVQAIAPERAISLRRVELGGETGAMGETELMRQLREESRRPFDLAQDMLLRALVVRVQPDEHVLMLTMHHIISDGWSLGILFRELATLYAARLAGAPANLPELPIQFADFVLWEREHADGPALEKSLAFWKQQLGDTLPVLELPADRARGVASSTHGAVQTISFAKPLATELKAFGQQEGATLFMTLLAAFQVLLHRWTGQEDIVVGSVVAGRRKTEVEKLIGFFVNTLVLRGDLKGNPTFRELLARVRDTSLAALAHQDMPFDRLVKELRPDRTVSRNPLFQVMFVLQNAPMAAGELPRLSLEPMDVDTGTAKFDLMLTMMEAPQGLLASFEYNADLFEDATIARMLGCFRTLLTGIVAQPNERIARLPLLTDAEREFVVTGLNQTATDYPREATIVELFERQVAARPETTALVFGGERMSYRELDARAGRLARRLRAAGAGPDVLVGVCLERSMELIVSLVAILKAGAAYVSLDPAYPAERLGFMLEDTRAPVLVTQATLAEKLPPHAAAVIRVDDPETWAVEVGSSDEGRPQDSRITAENLAYVSYTSGSTGKPKGVCVPHRGVVRLVQNADFARMGADEVFLQFAPIAFDASTLEIWGALLNGARLVIAPPGRSSLAELGATIATNGVTTLWLTAGLFHQMVEEEIGALRNVRQLLAGGDVLSAPHVARALEQLPRTQLINGYGPTENTTFTCCHRITAPPPAGRTVPIGRPIANTQVYILDGERQPVPIGVPGELYAGGDGLARGYLNRPELTEEKFVANPFRAESGARLYRTGDLARWLPDGSVEFLGRIDRQVKIRGFRVEPAEVEAVLATHPAVKECAVAVRNDASGGKCLAAYLVAKENPAPSVEVWRAYLESKVPEYLMPSAFVNLETLPLNANGKLDLAALPSWEDSRNDQQTEFVAPRDAVEQQLAEIWAAVLGVESIGVHDRFFDLGGHSLLAVRMIAHIEKRFGRKLPVSAIFQHRTIDQFARLLRPEAPVYASTSSLVEIQGKGERTPLYLVHGVGGGMFWGYANISKYLRGNRPIFAFKSRGLDGQPEWPSIEDMAKHYLADLRAQRPSGPYLLGGYCFGGVVAYEMARQLEAVGEKVSLLALINSTPPHSNYGVVANKWALRWQLRFWKNIFYWIGCFLFRWSVRERIEFMRWKVNALFRRAAGPLLAKNQTDIAISDVNDLPVADDYSDQQRELWQTHVRALVNYHPKSYGGRVTLFRTRGHSVISSFDDRFGWGELAGGGVDVKMMPGGHGNILDEPHVKSVASTLNASLEEADADAARKAGA